MRSKHNYFIYGILFLAIIGVIFTSGCVKNSGDGPGIIPQSDEALSDRESAKQQEVSPEQFLGAELSGCDTFPNKLDTCESFSCEFEHPFTGEMMRKEIVGLVDGKCQYTEEMPNNGILYCEYSESLRKAVAQYHRDVDAAESAGTSVNTDLGSGDVEITYAIDGKEVENPLQEAMDTGQCVISNPTYDIPDLESKCPAGTEYKGDSYSYENGEQITNTICSDPNMVCPPCENCVLGTSQKVIAEAEEVCYDCLFDDDCNEGFHCFDKTCLSNDVLINNPTSCADFDGYIPSDPCQEYSCEKCEKGHMVCQGGWNYWPSDMRDKCIECDDSFKDCIDGYKCEEYKCVVE